MTAIEGWLDLLACPICRGSLRLKGSELCCMPCQRSYSVQDGLFVLMRPEDVRRFDEFGQRYREERLRDGWRPMTTKQALALPYASPPGYPALYWQVRRQSYDTLLQALSSRGAASAGACAADLGAGTGWLSYRLAQFGYRVVAVEASRDDMFGLGAAVAHYASRALFLPVLGSLEHPPLSHGQFQLVVFNASLHYAQNLEATLQQAASALAVGGWLVIMDTPIARQPRPGTGRGDRHLSRRELEDALAAAGLAAQWISVRRGPGWWFHQAKAMLKGSERFSFPLLMAGPYDTR